MSYPFRVDSIGTSFHAYDLQKRECNRNKKCKHLILLNIMSPSRSENEKRYISIKEI
jgi:hypothetical protein